MHLPVQSNGRLPHGDKKVEEDGDKTEFGNYEEVVFEMQAKVGVFKG